MSISLPVEQALVWAYRDQRVDRIEGTVREDGRWGQGV